MGAVVDAPQPAGVDVAVDLRRRERRVAEELLDRPQVGTALEQMRCVCVPQPVRVRDEPSQHARVEPAAADRDEEGITGAAHEPRAAVSKPGAQAPDGLLAERHEPFLPSLAAHVDLLAVEVEVGDVEVDRLRRTQTRGVDELEQRRVSERERFLAGRSVDELLDVRDLRHLGEAPTAAWRERCVRNASGAKGVTHERAHRGEAARDRGRREPSSGAPELCRVLGQDPHVDVVELEVPLSEPG